MDSVMNKHNKDNCEDHKNDLESAENEKKKSTQDLIYKVTFDL